MTPKDSKMTQFESTPRHSDMLIKVCGMRDPENIRAVASLTPMLMGFIFYEQSPRYAGNLDPEVVSELPSFVRPVALFVNSTAEKIDEITNRYGIKVVQLHGDESPQFCQKLRDRGLIVLKAVPVSDIESLQALEAYHGAVDGFVFDSPSEKRGGSGKKFDWAILENYHGSTPYLLGGGIGPDDVDEIISAMRPGMAGIDINSRFESSCAIKDISLLTRFILSLRKYNEDNSPATPFWEKAQ